MAARLKREAEERRRSVGVNRDAERARLLSAAVDSAQDAILTLTPSGTITSWNPAAERLFGYAAAEAIGTSIDMLAAPGRADEAAALREWVLSGKPLSPFETVRMHQDGRSIDVCVSISPIRSASGEVIGLCSIVRDITAIKEIYEERAHAARMDAIGKLTGRMAHDFNNILTVIMGTIGIVAHAVADDPKLARCTQLIQNAAKSGALLTSNLLAFARRQPLNPAQVDINALIVEAAKQLRPSLEHIDIESKLAGDLWAARVDSAELTRALTHLVTNAREAMPDGGKLRFETGNVRVAPSPAQSHDAAGKAGYTGDYVLIAVGDSGVGIPASHRSSVFEPFFSTKAHGQGTGLGLSMVYGFIKQSGGHIEIESEENRGTTIKMYLPRASDAGARSELH
jgi:PAS domain S-box-containing protein